MLDKNEQKLNQVTVAVVAEKLSERQSWDMTKDQYLSIQQPSCIITIYIGPVFYRRTYAVRRSMP